MSRGSPALIVLVALGLVLLAAPLFAESTDILVTGPDQERGIPYLGANTIPFLRGAYAPQPSTGEVISAPDRIRVLYTDSPIVPPASWKGAGCAAVHLLAASPDVYYYASDRGWSLFFDFPAGTKARCTFASTFITRFVYFLGITKDAAYSSFPAILKLP